MNGRAICPPVDYDASTSILSTDALPFAPNPRPLYSLDPCSGLPIMCGDDGIITQSTPCPGLNFRPGSDLSINTNPRNKSSNKYLATRSSLPGLPLTFAVINCRSLVHKMPLLLLFMTVHQCDVLFLSETWLNDYLICSCITQNGYVMYRKDRFNNRLGGGVAILIKKEFASCQVEVKHPVVALFDLCCIDVQIDKYRYRFISVYRPPGVLVSNIIDAALLNSCLTDLLNSPVIFFIAGDFNLPQINWNTFTAPNDDVHDTLLNLFEDHNLSQLILVPTRKNNILDLFLTNAPSLVSDYHLADPLGSSDHSSIILEVNISSKKPTSSPRKISRIIWFPDLLHLAQNHICSYNWNYLFSGAFSSEIVWTTFCSVLHHAISLSSHIVHMRLNHSSKRPHNHTLKRLFNLKRKIWQTLRTATPASLMANNLHNRYKALNSRIHYTILNLRREKEKTIVAKGDVKQFYKFANSALHAPSHTSSLKSSGGNIISDPAAKAEMFNNTFAEAFTIDDNFLPPSTFQPLPSCSLGTILFPASIVLPLILKLKKSHTITPDGFSSHTLFTLGHCLACPLASLFEHFFSHNYVPDQWKISFITPLYKKGPRSDPANYRPIAITSILCRIMERIIHKQVTSYLILNNLISPSQHGFCSGKSSVTNLLESTTDWFFNIDSRNNIDIIYLDLTRAFDSVSHCKLYHKLLWFGLSDNILNWIPLFLSNRSQCTVVEGVYSKFLPVLSGVPQGSVLGPLLFLLYTNDLIYFLSSVPYIFNSSTKLFADDIKSYAVVNSIDDAIQFQLLIHTIFSWCSDWQLNINHSKCLILHLGKSNDNFKYHLSGFVVPYSHFVSDLGITIDCNLLFDKHIDNIVSKARNRCKVFLKYFISRDKDTMLKFFITYVRPILEYGSSIWSPTSSSLIAKIEGVQRFFTNKIPTCTFLPYSQRLNILSINSLFFRRTVTDLTLLHSIVSGNTTASLFPHISFVPPSITRSHNFKLLVPLLHFKSLSHNFVSRTSLAWNKLPSHLFDAPSTHAFRRLLQCNLPDPYFL